MLVLILLHLYAGTYARSSRGYSFSQTTARGLATGWETLVQPSACTLRMYAMPEHISSGVNGGHVLLRKELLPRNAWRVLSGVYVALLHVFAC